MKAKIQKIGSAVFAAASLAFFAQLYHRLTALPASAPPQKAPGSDGRGFSPTKKPPVPVLETGEKKIKTAFIDCNGIYN